MKKLMSLSFALLLAIALTGCSAKSDSVSETNNPNSTDSKIPVELSTAETPPQINSTPIILRITGADETNKDVDIFKVLHPNYAELWEKFYQVDNNSIGKPKSVETKLEDLNIDEIAKKPGAYSYRILEPISPAGQRSSSSEQGIFHTSAESGLKKIHISVSGIDFIDEYGYDNSIETINKFLADAVANTNKASDTEEIKKIKDLIEKRRKTLEEAQVKIKELHKAGQRPRGGVIRIIDSPKMAARWLNLSDDEAKAYMEVLHKIDPQATQFPHLLTGANTTFSGTDVATGTTYELNKQFAKGVVLLPSEFAAKYANQTVILSVSKSGDNAKWYLDQKLKRGIPTLAQYQLHIVNETIQEAAPPKP